MNPDKLFDYLDGKLSPADRTELEEKLMSDAQLRRQFNIAREIHRSGSDSRETVVPVDAATAEHGGRTGRRIATAAIVLVFMNVLIGLAVITVKNKKKSAADPKEAAIRQQLAESLGAAAQNAMPPPTFTANEIQIAAPRAAWGEIADKIVKGAGNFGGSAAKGLPEEDFVTVVADVPSKRESEFRQTVISAAAISPMPDILPGRTPLSATSTDSSFTTSVTASERTIVQIRIAEAAR